MTDYVILDKKEKDLLDKQTVLTWADAEMLIEYWDIFKKFLNKTKFSFQLSLLDWSFRWKEENLYISMEAMDQTIKSLDSIWDAFKKYNLQKKNN